MICKCGHEDSKHHHLKSCTAITDEVKLKFCQCGEFRESNSIQTGDDEMAKKQRVKKPKGRKPVLAEFIDGPMNIFATYKKKEIEARVRADGVIVHKDKEYATPNAAGMAATGRDHGIDGYRFWRFKKNGEEVPLDAIRGSKSPLKAAAPRKAKAKYANGAPPAKKRIRKPRAKRVNAEVETVQSAEATA